MPFVEVIAQLVLTIEPHTAIEMGAMKEGAVVFLHVAAVLSRTTKGASASMRTLTRSRRGDVLDLIVHWRHYKCDRGLRVDVVLRSEGYVDGLRGCGVNNSLVYTMVAIDFGKWSIVTQ
jgi:hypothetical protein